MDAHDSTGLSSRTSRRSRHTLSYLKICSPAVADLKAKNIELSYFPAAVDSNELMSAIATMYNTVRRLNCRQENRHKIAE